MIEQKDWQWFGSPAHFICADWCRFHMATVVGRFIVSTVGEYIHPRHGQGKEQSEQEWLKENWPGEDIGLDRKYETMVFLADFFNRCSSSKCGCGMPPLLSAVELDMKGYMRAKEATEGHLALCLKWAQDEQQDRSFDDTEC